jgi:hypothetical protein
MMAGLTAPPQLGDPKFAKTYRDKLVKDLLDYDRQRFRQL